MGQLNAVTADHSQAILLWVVGAMAAVFLALQLWRLMTQPREAQKIEQPIRVTSEQQAVTKDKCRILHNHIDEKFSQFQAENQKQFDQINNRLLLLEEDRLRLRAELKTSMDQTAALIREEVGKVHQRVNTIDRDIGALTAMVERLGVEMANITISLQNLKNS